MFCWRGGAGRGHVVAPANQSEQQNPPARQNKLLHHACLHGNQKRILELLRGNAANEVNGWGETPLFIALGNRHDMDRDDSYVLELLSDILRTLMEKNCALDDRDAEGNNMFHILTLLSVDETPAIMRNRDIILGWFRDSLCQASSLTLNRGALTPEDYMTSPRQYALGLLRAARNEKGLDVGAADIFTYIFSIPGLMFVETATHFVYDVTDMIPATKCVRRCLGCREPAYLERLLYERNQEATCKILDCQPFGRIEKMWSRSLWLFNIARIVTHVLIMSLISYLGVEALLSHCREETSLMPLFVIPFVESFVILIFFGWTVFNWLPSPMETCGRTSSWCGCSLQLSREKKKFKTVTYLTFDFLILFLFVATYFGSAAATVIRTATWDCGQPYSVAPYAVMVFSGWMYTVYLCSDFEKFHRVWHMIVHIFFRDIVFFSFVFAFLFLAIACAMHPMFMLHENLQKKYPTIWDTMFLVFHLTTGLWEAFDGSLADNIDKLDFGAKVFLKVGSTVFALWSIILLLNLLIAMMNDTVAYLKEQDTHMVYRSAQFQQRVWGLTALRKGLDKRRNHTSQDTKNKVLHLACKHGNEEVILAQLNKSSESAKETNRFGETPLFIALGNRHITMETVDKLMGKMDEQALLMRTQHKQNVFHQAARYASLEVLQKLLTKVDQEKSRHNDFLSLIEKRPSMTSAMTKPLLPLFVWNVFKHDIEDKKLLSLVLRELVKRGSDLGEKDANGNNMFHILTILSTKKSYSGKTHNMILYLFKDTLRKVGDLSLVLQQSRGGKTPVPEHIQSSPRKSAFRLLTERNSNDLDVGADDILERIFSIPGLMFVETATHLAYDVTDMIPATKDRLRKGGCWCWREPAYLERLLYKRHRKATCKVLETQPFQSIEKSQVSWLTLLNIVYFLLHASIMTVVSAWGITMVDGSCDDQESPWIRLLIVPPLLESFFMLFTFCVTVYNCGPGLKGEFLILWQMVRRLLCKSSHTNEKKAISSLILDLFFQLLFVATYFGSVAATCIYWAHVEECIQGNTDMILPFSVALFSGWMYAVFQCSGFPLFHRVWHLMVRIFVRDILVFCCVYGFLFLAFACALHPVFVQSVTLKEHYPTLWDTMFLVFHLTSGFWEAFEGDLPDAVTGLDEQAKGFIKVGSVIFTIMSVILLLNLLIAMMNETMSNLRETKHTYYRFARFQQGLWGLKALKKRDYEKGEEDLMELGLEFPEPQPQNVLVVPKDNEHGYKLYDLNLETTNFTARM
ncbi:hypothetical protein BaRGS_00027813 [Batillaria attramentaria]|uniref:Ion transport domain-containing protein n=1 Tax=Batillaria attramentaria TaxID=370345 RepID=A0ABD0K209_9CAEN